MTTQTQRFNAVMRKHQETSFMPFSRSLLANVEYKPRELKEFVKDELYFWVNLQSQALTSDVQRHLGKSYHYSLAYCFNRIEHLREIIADMKYKVYTCEGNGFFCINPSKVRPHFIAFN